MALDFPAGPRYRKTISGAALSACRTGDQPAWNHRACSVVARPNLKAKFQKAKSGAGRKPRKSWRSPGKARIGLRKIEAD
ncbi:hypothetical protein ACFQS7_01745 [Dankookia sp. GCM10030260]|uniref:hypothetical protein n=1 Tax=Dankookia sp. GCM10030260 TaxID=3273390 RepID=UPI0036235F97